MIVIFNVYALLSVTLGVMVAWLMAMGGHTIAGIVVGCLIAAAIDLLQRFGNRENYPAALVHQSAGGHLFYIPVWIWPVFGLMAVGMNSLGLFDVKEKPRQPRVVQHPQQEEPQQQPPQQQPQIQPQPSAKPALAAAIPAAPSKPSRLSFAEAAVTPIELTNGSTSIQDGFTEQDAVDRGTKDLPVKVYEIRLAAETGYWFIPGSPFSYDTHGLRVEDQQGQLLALGEPSVVLGPARLLFIPPKEDSYRVVISGRLRSSGKFALVINEVTDHDPPKELERLKPTCGTPLSLKVALKTDMYLSAAVATDSQSAWVAFPKGKLQRFSCPELMVTGQFEFPKQAYQLAINGRGVLCGSVQRENPKQAPLPWSGLGPADIHLYDTTSLPAEKKVLKPEHIVKVNGLVESLLVSPDDEWLYYLDSTNHVVGRVNLTTGKLDCDNRDIDPTTKSICLPADGHAVYTCGEGNVVQRLDPATLKIEQTIRLDRGSPTGIQATTRGDLFLKGNEGPFHHIYVIDGRHEDRDDIVQPLPWAKVYQPNSLMLSPDQAHLFASCFSLSPANITSYHIPHVPALHRAEKSSGISLSTGSSRGTMAISPDGRFLFSDSGFILEIEQAAQK